jgi:hypothetical protein
VADEEGIERLYSGLFLQERLVSFFMSKLADGLSLDFIEFVTGRLLDRPVVEIQDCEIVSAIFELI